MSSGRHADVSTTENVRALLRAAKEIHDERHGAQTFIPGTHLPLDAAGERLGPKRLRYYDAVEEGRAGMVRPGGESYVITERGLEMLSAG